MLYVRKKGVGIMTLKYSDLYKYRLLEELLEHVNDGINVVDIKGNIVYSNKVSAVYANTNTEKMLGEHISKFYPEAVLLNVLKDRKPILDKKIHYVGQKKYVVNSYPIYIENTFVGAFSIFKDIRDIDELNRRIKYLELHLALNRCEESILDIIGNEGSLKDVLIKAKRTVGSLGGPRHSIITGESGTGKTMLAKLIYNYAKEVGVIDKDAPFIEINCAQFTNPDIAAVEIFGSEEGAYTGSRQKKGLFEQSNGGILFLDEAHALEHYQSLLLKGIESGNIRRIGGSKEISVDVIIIAASTKDLRQELLPELYQRLAQYELYLPSLQERSLKEKELLFRHFINKYESAVKNLHNIEYDVMFTKEAKSILLQAVYPRNIRQFRDVINFSIDAAAPLIADISNENKITTVVETKHLPFQHFEDKQDREYSRADKKDKLSGPIKKMVMSLNKEGLGPRKIANILKEKGYNIEYYQIAYYLKKEIK